MKKEQYGYRFEDIPLVRLVPKKDKKQPISSGNYKKSIRRIRASLEHVGMLELFHVHPIGDDLYQVDEGNLRYEQLLELGVESVPCLVFDVADTYTPTRQVNHLSPVEETRMIKKAREEVQGNRIAQVFGLKYINGSHLKPEIVDRLHSTIIHALNDCVISKSAAEELSKVTPERQLEIFAQMQNANVFSTSFVKAQILKTSPPQRNKLKTKTPWQENLERKNALIHQLEEIEKEHEHYASLYRQYTTDLMLVTIHVREILSKETLRNYLKMTMPLIFTEFCDIVEKVMNEKTKSENNE